MSSRVEVWADPEAHPLGLDPQPVSSDHTNVPCIGSDLTWKQHFLQDQLHRLVRRLYLSGRQTASRQIVFSSVASNRGTAWLCARIAELLSGEVLDDICVVEADVTASNLSEELGITTPAQRANSGLARKNGGNLWFCSANTLFHASEWSTKTETLRHRMARLKKEFGHLIIHAPPVAVEESALVLGQMTEGIVLVLEADVTRRAAAVYAKELLSAAGVNLLGFVLGERNFPIPHSIYDRV